MTQRWAWLQAELSGIGAFTVPQGLTALGAVLAAAMRHPCAAGSHTCAFTTGRISWTTVVQATGQAGGEAAAFLTGLVVEREMPPSASPAALDSPVESALGSVTHRWAAKASDRIARLEIVVRHTAQAIVGRPIAADEPLMAAGMTANTRARGVIATALR